MRPTQQIATRSIAEVGQSVLPHPYAQELKQYQTIQLFAELGVHIVSSRPSACISNGNQQIPVFPKLKTLVRQLHAGYFISAIVILIGWVLVHFFHQ